MKALVLPERKSSSHFVVWQHLPALLPIPSPLFFIRRVPT